MADLPPSDFDDMSSDDECQELEIVTSQHNPPEPESNSEASSASNMNTPRSQHDDDFAKIIVDRLSQLTHDQRVIAQREILRILNQWNPPGGHQADQGAPSAPPAPSEPPAQQHHVLQPLYGINYLQPRRLQDGLPPRRHAGASESPDIEWGDIFTPHNNVGP